MGALARTQSLEHTVQSWWLASMRLNDCAGDEFTMRVVKESLRALRLNDWSSTVAEFADRELRQMDARRFHEGAA
jgi:hypothetical protein